MSQDVTFVNPGDRFTFRASTLNAMLQMVNAWKSGKLGGTSGDTGGNRPDVVIVKNMTEVDLTFGNAVSLESPLFDVPNDSDKSGEQLRHFLDRTYKAVKPKENYPLAITLEPIGKGKIGRVAVSGIVRTVVDVKSKDHARVTFTDDTVELESSDDGDLSFYIPPKKTGKQWCDLQFGSPGEAAPSSDLLTTVKTIITHTTPGTVEGLSSNDLVYGDILNPYQVCPPGIRVIIGKLGNRWQVKTAANLTYQLISPPPTISINTAAGTVTISTPYTAARIAGTIYNTKGETISTFDNRTSPYNVTPAESGFVSAYTTSGGLIDSPVVTQPLNVALTPLISYNPATRIVTVTLPETGSGTTITRKITWSDGSTPRTDFVASGATYTLDKSATVSAYGTRSGSFNSPAVEKYCEVT